MRISLIKRHGYVLLPLIYLLFAIVSCSKDSTNVPESDLYFPRVKSIIQANCISCHSPGGQGSPLFLTSDTIIVDNAARIKAAVIDPPTPLNKRMPQGGELSDTDKNIILKWYEKGGKSTD